MYMFIIFSILFSFNSYSHPHTFRELVINVEEAGVCKTFKFINQTNEKEYTKSDEDAMNTATRTCFYTYDSCLYRLIKKPKRTYNAICKEE